MQFIVKKFDVVGIFLVLNLSRNFEHDLSITKLVYKVLNLYFWFENACLTNREFYYKKYLYFVTDFKNNLDDKQKVYKNYIIHEITFRFIKISSFH